MLYHGALAEMLYPDHSEDVDKLCEGSSLKRKRRVELMQKQSNTPFDLKYRTWLKNAI